MATIALTVNFGTSFNLDTDGAIQIDGTIETMNYYSIIIIPSQKSPIIFALNPIIIDDNIDDDSTYVRKVGRFNRGFN